MADVLNGLAQHIVLLGASDYRLKVYVEIWFDLKSIKISRFLPIFLIKCNPRERISLPEYQLSL